MLRLLSRAGASGVIWPSVRRRPGKQLPSSLRVATSSTDPGDRARCIEAARHCSLKAEAKCPHRAVSAQDAEPESVKAGCAFRGKRSAK